MRTAGFPCRLLGCEQVFTVTEQNSMDALNAASAARTAHELESHDYRHIRLADEAMRMPYQRTNSRPAPKAVPRS